jgi:hypothetical protein
VSYGRGQPRFARRRDANEPAIVAALQAAGCVVTRLHEPVDLLVGRDGTNYLLEVKLPLGPCGGRPASELGKSQRIQTAWLGSWIGQVSIVRTPEEALAAVGIVTGIR